MDDDVIDSGEIDPVELDEPVQSVADAALEAMDMPADDEPADDAPLAPVKAEKPAPEVKPVDPKTITDEDLQRPENLSHKGRDRFEKLVGGYKAEKARADEAHVQLEQYTQSFKALQDLGFKDEAAANDLMQFSKYRQALAGDGKEAVRILQEQIRLIERQFGHNVQASALEGHDDLIQAVQGEQLQYPQALELARAREQQRAQQQQNQQFQRQQETQFQSQQTVQNSIQTIEGMEANWRATDPDYAAIHPHIHAEMQTIAKQFPPNMWPQQINLLYSTTKRAMASQRRPNVGQPAPLRGNGHAASRPAPKTTAEAALLAMGMEV